MKKNRLQKTFSRIATIGALQSDSEELRLQKSILVICSIPFLLAGVGWGAMYMLFGEKLAGMIPLSYAFISFASLIYFGLTRKFQVFRFSQLLLILLLPFALMLSLGGFVNGSAVILWGLICPLGAMLFDKQSKAPLWLLAYCFLVVISLILQPWLRIQNNLTTVQINLFFVINLMAVGSLIFLMVYYFVGKKNFFQARSETLLLNILPKEIAEELKANGSAEAKQFDDVTVMFTDFKDFTQITEKLTPTQLVAEIDFCFKAFDRIVSKFNIEKIKTIGDSYMCAGGLPVPNKTNATDVVSAAMEIQQFMQQYSHKKMTEGNEAFEIRIGIHTGPVVAGIVGVKKFAYDIWGDTVNIASRMESSGIAGKVNISGTTHELVKDKFTCTYRGKIEAKHKGMIDMYFAEAFHSVRSTSDQ
ncbi:MAG TPA: adenylate/guanylate cyclase domain-containing protein [Chitinophagales bacterium]|nr:adenylate/guanylate cyclase domain-containing protein [Chitinophagales bacterium]